MEKNNVHIYTMDWCKKIIVTVINGTLTEEIKNMIVSKYPDYKIDVA